MQGFWATVMHAYEAKTSPETSHSAMGMHFCGSLQSHDCMTTCLSIQLQQEVMAIGSTAEAEVYESVHSKLPDIIESPSAQVLAQLESEVGGRTALVPERLMVQPRNHGSTIKKFGAGRGEHLHMIYCDKLHLDLCSWALAP